MFKKNLKSSLFLTDFAVLVTIFFCVYLLFEFVINKILIDYSIDKFYDSMRSTQFDLNNSMSYIEDKKELDYSRSAEETFDYIKISTLKRSRYDNSIFALVFPEDGEDPVFGERKQPDIKMENKYVSFDNFNKQLEKNVTNTSTTNYIEFTIKGKNYIGIAAYSESGIRKSLDRKNELIYPIIVIADDRGDFFYRINNVRNIFFALFLSVFGIGALFKIFNTINITREIHDVRDRMSRAGKEIREAGLIGETGALKKKFIETSDLDDSFSELTGALSDLGEIISGIADRDLFIATLKKDDSLLKPHDEMMTIMFLDIQNFTGITESHKDDIMELINHVWTEIENIISKNKGKINKLIGDAALLIFLDNHNTGKTNSAVNAFYSAVELLNRVPVISRDLGIEINFRIGLDYGKVTYGKTGSDKNYELGVIGDTVNTASRLESLCKQYHTNLLLTEDLYRNLMYRTYEEINLMKEINSENGLLIRLFVVDKVRPKGKKEAKEIFTVIKRQNKNFSILGSELYYDVEFFNKYHQFLTMFINSIKEWRAYFFKKQDEKELQLSNETIELKINAERNWSVLVKDMAGYYFNTKLPLLEHFIRTILKFEEYDEFLKYPEDWLKKDLYKVKEPSSDWIVTGTVELEK